MVTMITKLRVDKAVTKYIQLLVSWKNMVYLFRRCKVKKRWFQNLYKWSSTKLQVSIEVGKRSSYLRAN